MKKLILILGAMLLLFGFAPNEKTIEEIVEKTITGDETIIEEITLFNQIIEKKLSAATSMENRALILLEKDGDSKKALKLLEEAQLQRMMTLKYKAAIACRVRSVKNN